VHEAYTCVTTTDGATAARQLRDAGATVIGAWNGAGSIGWWDDEVVVLAGWPGAHGEVEGDRLRATARPTTVEPLAPGGVFAHRWMHFDPAHWDEVLELSTGAWPAFERTYGATIEGFLRAEAGDRVLLITRYPSVAAWETSRGIVREDDEDAQDAARRFQRRRELTERAIVRIGRLVEIERDGPPDWPRDGRTLAP
jgi:hypothetical protein